MSKFLKMLSALVLAACVVPALAQDGEKPDRIVLEQKAGSVMTTTGGDYETANLGKLLVVDESMMLADGAKAQVVYYYDNGKRKCVENYEGPNTFIIDDSCKKAAYITDGGSQLGSAAVIAGTAVLGAALLQSGDDAPPLSLGPNGVLRKL